MPQGQRSNSKGSSKPSRKQRTSKLRGLRTQRVRTFSLETLRKPENGWAIVIALIFLIVMSWLALAARERPTVAVDRLATRSLVVRAPVTLIDETTTAVERDKARSSVAPVYLRMDTSFDAIRAELLALEPPEDQAEGYEVRVANLLELLELNPIVEPSELETADSPMRGSGLIELRGGRNELVSEGVLLRTNEPDRLAELSRTLTRRADLPDALAEQVTSIIAAPDRATYRFAEAATRTVRDEAAERVEIVEQTIPAGQLMVRRGDVVTDQQARLIRAEAKARAESLTAWERGLNAAGTIAAVLVVTMALAAYIVSFCPQIKRSPPRIAWIAVLLGGSSIVAVAGSLAAPNLIAGLAPSPVVLAGVILTVAYDRRTALALASLAGLLVAISLHLPLSWYALIVAGLAAGVYPLSEIRDRNVLIRMGIVLALSLGIGTAIVEVIEGPIGKPLIDQILWPDALFALFGGLVVASLTMFILPTIERVFEITTGLTLVELRDPKQPLLRELQQRAPGTYNHSLNVAGIAEAAADAIGADSLLTYVGALYHDIGKMNKPEYFVENQSGGPNKHDKLSPAMSLLVIVGHVKDGVEIAKEYGLPKQFIHFIEAHHGTTLVEYFYRRAVDRAIDQAGGQTGGQAEKKAEKKAGGSGKQDESKADSKPESKTESELISGQHLESLDLPTELEYRYPGPKPQTREAAIMMLSDAVESATRTLAEPTPSRIDALVRQLANKRLLDGQFDECSLTLRDLNAVVASISRTVASIYHGRISYPSGDAKDASKPKDAKTSSAG